MPDLEDGQTAQAQGSAREPYALKNIGGVYSCNCPAWRNQSLPIERRTCKHIIKLRGEKAEARYRTSFPFPRRTLDEHTTRSAGCTVTLERPARQSAPQYD